MSKPIRRHNRSYSGGYPLAVGDRYYAQDLFRDHAYLESMVGISYNDLIQRSAPFIINGLVASQGTGHTMDITAGKAIVPFTVTIPDTAAAWTIPPSTTTGNINMIIDYAGGSSLSLASTVTDGATPNYVKLAYTETNGNTRNRAKKTGSYAYEVYDTVTVTIDDTAPTGTEITILTFTTDGATVTITDNGDTRIGSPFHMFDAVVYDQNSFNNIIRRVAANQYKIRDDIKSVYFSNLSGGYDMYSGSSPLSGGDTWGYIQTNNCVNVIFENGAYLYFENTQGYLQINTNNCVLNNVGVIGLGTVASAITRSFYITGTYTTLNNCYTNTRLSNDAFDAFLGVSSYTQKFNNCRADNLESSLTMRGFINCDNCYNCYAENLTATGGFCVGFAGCNFVTDSYVITLNTSGGGGVTGFGSCDHVENCYVNGLSSNVDTVIAFNSCNHVSNCEVTTLDHNGAVASKHAYGFRFCDYISSCKVNDLDVDGATGDVYGFYDCEHISESYVNDINSTGAGGNSYGFSNCNNVGSCTAINITSSGGICYGFFTCNNITTCKSNVIDSSADDSYGFNTCLYISSCSAITVSHSGSVANKKAYGFSNCDNVSSCYANGIDSDADDSFGFFACDNVTSSKAFTIDHSGSIAGKNAYGFNACNYISSCYADDIDTNGAGGVAYGFYNCDFITTSVAVNCFTGFELCEFISTSKASTCGGNGFSSCTDVNNCNSINNTGYGFNSCYPLANNRATGNTAGQYNANCYANWGASVAVADTATGGYNG